MPPEYSNLVSLFLEGGVGVTISIEGSCARMDELAVVFLNILLQVLEIRQIDIHDINSQVCFGVP